MFEQCSLNLFNARHLDCLASGTDRHVQTINITIFRKSRNCNIGNFPVFKTSGNQHQSHVWARQPESSECETSDLPGLRNRQPCSNHQNHDFHKIQKIATSEISLCSQNLRTNTKVMFEQCSLNPFKAKNLNCLASGKNSHVQTIKIMIFTKSRNCNIRFFLHVHKIWESTSKSCLSNAAWIFWMREIWIAWPQEPTGMFKPSKAWFSENPEIATSESFLCS